MKPTSSTTWLFVPGTRLERFSKASTSGADEVVYDLEDAVTANDKAIARQNVARYLAGGGQGWVRINDPSTPWWEQDVNAVANLAGLRGVMVPKAESTTALQYVADRLPGSPLIALVETALGVTRAFELAQSPCVDGLAFGSIDFATDIDAEHDDDSLLLARSTLIIASRAAGKRAPLDGVTTAIDAPDVVAAAARRAKALGFGGKLCIHPAQIAAVAAGFAPTDRELSWAKTVLAATQSRGTSAGVTTIDGHMIDRPVVERARRVLDRAWSHDAQSPTGDAGTAS